MCLLCCDLYRTIVHVLRGGIITQMQYTSPLLLLYTRACPCTASLPVLPLSLYIIIFLSLCWTLAGSSPCKHSRLPLRLSLSLVPRSIKPQVLSPVQGRPCAREPYRLPLLPVPQPVRANLNESSPARCTTTAGLLPYPVSAEPVCVSRSRACV